MMLGIGKRETGLRAFGALTDTGQVGQAWPYALSSRMRRRSLLFSMAPCTAWSLPPMEAAVAVGVGPGLEAVTRRPEEGRNDGGSTAVQGRACAWSVR